MGGKGERQFGRERERREEREEGEERGLEGRKRKHTIVIYISLVLRGAGKGEKRREEKDGERDRETIDL